jgi:GNAT superfamily N-acetyltransferase
LYAAAPSVGANARIRSVGRAVALCLDGVKHEMLGRVFGLGLHEPATREGVEATVDWFRTCDAGPFLVHASPGARPGEVRDWLVGSGLRRHRAWMKFARERGAVGRPASELAVRRVGPELGQAFADIACATFELPEGSHALVARITDLEGWHAFVSFAGQTPAGAGALFVSDGVGWLGFGATKPEFRSRGGQAAVIAARLEAAFDLGCRLVITETGVAKAGDPQHSYKNILKAGFRELYERDNFMGGEAGHFDGAGVPRKTPASPASQRSGGE